MSTQPPCWLARKGRVGALRTIKQAARALRFAGCYSEAPQEAAASSLGGKTGAAAFRCGASYREAPQEASAFSLGGKTGAAALRCGASYRGARKGPVAALGANRVTGRAGPRLRFAGCYLGGYSIAALALISAGVARADVDLSVVVNGFETPATSPLDFGNVAQGDTKTIRIRMRNNGATSPIQVVVLEASGAGFSLQGAPPIPFVLAPGGGAAGEPGTAQDFDVAFTAGAASSYSGNLQVNSVSLILLASASPAPDLTVLPSCTATMASSGAAFSGVIDFGQVVAGQSKVCDFKLTNQSSDAETIFTFIVNGAGFQGPVGVDVPMTLVSLQASGFTIGFNSAQPGIYSGILTIASRTYQLTVTVLAPPLPAPVLSFDTTLVESGEQHTLSMGLPSPSPVDATGNVNLTFVPDSSAVPADPAIMFVASGTHTLPFSVKAGSKQILIGGATGAVFQTGTSAGRIRFTISGVAQGLNGDSTTELRVAPSTVSVQSAAFTARPGDLDLQITGFDNTYSTGKMSFTFYNAASNPIDPGTIESDFTQPFQSYFSTSQSGSMFQMRVSFPVSGSQLGIAMVDVTLGNTAGSATIRKLPIQ